VLAGVQVGAPEHLVRVAAERFARDQARRDRRRGLGHAAVAWRPFEPVHQQYGGFTSSLAAPALAGGGCGRICV